MIASKELTLNKCDSTHFLTNFTSKVFGRPSPTNYGRPVAVVSAHESTYVDLNMQYDALFNLKCTAVR